MKAFIVELQNRPGELARVTDVLGKAGVNISSGAGIGLGPSGAFGFMTDNEAAAMSALSASACTFRTVDVLTAAVPDRAGGLATVAGRLAAAGVNVELVLPMGMSDGAMTVAFGIDDAQEARAALA